MIIHAELKRKQSEYEGEACAVDKVIELPAQRFQQFSRVLLADYDFIEENKICLLCPPNLKSEDNNMSNTQATKTNDKLTIKYVLDKTEQIINDT